MRRKRADPCLLACIVRAGGQSRPERRAACDEIRFRDAARAAGACHGEPATRVYGDDGALPDEVLAHESYTHASQVRGRIEALVIASLTESNGAADALVAAFEYDWAAAIFAFLVAEPGWAERLPRIAEQYSTMWVVPNFVYGLARMAYEHQHLEQADQDSIEEFFRTFFTNYHVFENGRHRRMWIGEEMERLKKARKMTRQRLQEGQRAIEGLISGFAEQEGAGDDD